MILLYDLVRKIGSDINNCRIRRSTVFETSMDVFCMNSVDVLIACLASGHSDSFL